jgi:hypothetical protein
MNLNLPEAVLDRLSSCQNILIAGMGGGFDVFCGLPLCFELRRRGLRVHLANLSFSSLGHLPPEDQLGPTLFAVRGDPGREAVMFPELHLATWLREKYQEEQIVWCFKKAGARPLLEAYRTLAAHLQLDAIVLVDGGVDSLMRGDEEGMGTVLEDWSSLYAVNQLDHLSVRVACCVGMGAEREVNHSYAFENMAALAATDAFLGSCSLVRAMDAYQAYEAALLHVQGQPYQDPSVINSSIVSAVRGEFGDYHLTKKTHGSRLRISPLMPIYWFFDLPALAARNLMLADLALTETFSDMLRVIAGNRPPTRPEVPIGFK